MKQATASTPGERQMNLLRATQRAELDVLDPKWVVRPLRMVFVLAAIISQLAFFGDTYGAHTQLALRFERLTQPYGLFTLGASVLAVVISLTPLFERHWKAITLDLALFLVAGWTYITVLNDQQVQLFVAILVVLMATCALVPWELAWQASLTAACLALAGLNTVLVHPSNPFIGCLWLQLITASAVTLSGNRLWSKWRAALTESNAILREEVGERKQMARRLSESEANLRKIFDGCPEIICVHSMIDDHYIDVNPSFSATGHTRQEAMAGATKASELWVSVQQFRNFQRQLTDEGFVRNLEADIRLKDCTTHPCLVSSVLVELDGEPCAVTFISDITQLIAAREAALAASRAKSEFLSSMSHEIRTPLNSILGTADLLAESTLTPDQSHLVEIMSRNGTALLDLINGILDLAKVESGRLRLEETEFEVHDVVEGVTETLALRAHAKGIELATRILPDVPLKLVGDPLRLRQVLINLVANAIKFTQHGEVVLTVRQHKSADRSAAAGGQEYLQFSVKDTGIGIPADKLDAVFQSFTQADSSVTRKYGGSGLGLAIARRLVNLMGGTITVESEVGKGSTFAFISRFKSADSAAESAAQPSFSDLRILVVDDHATNRQIASEILASRGASVSEAADATQALAEIKSGRRNTGPYHVVLLDYGLLDGDGLELAKKLRPKQSGNCATVVMLTSDNLNAQLARLRHLNLPDYLVKPIKRSQLLDTVAAVTGKSTARPKPAEEPAQARTADLRPMRILLADDSGDNRSLIQAYLRKCPFELDEAENGEVAAEKFRRNRYDLVLMDMQMPVMDGYTATRKIRSWESEGNRPATPIIALTASALEEDVRNTREAGCTTHLSKPVKKSRLLDVIKDLAGAPESSQPVEQRSESVTASAA